MKERSEELKTGLDRGCIVLCSIIGESTSKEWCPCCGIKYAEIEAKCPLIKYKKQLEREKMDTQPQPISTATGHFTPRYWIEFPVTNLATAQQKFDIWIHESSPEILLTPAASFDEFKSSHPQWGLVCIGPFQLEQALQIAFEEAARRDWCPEWNLRIEGIMQ